MLTLRNGYTVTGKSACASPENFDAEIGKRIARENAVQEIWPLMGYELKQRLHDGPRASAHDIAQRTAGAVYAFAAWLTTRDKPITLGSTHEAGPAAEAVKDFLMHHKLDDIEPEVRGWNAPLVPGVPNSAPTITARELAFALNYHGDDARLATPDFEVAAKYFDVVKRNRGTHPSLGGPALAP